MPLLCRPASPNALHLRVNLRCRTPPRLFLLLLRTRFPPFGRRLRSAAASGGQRNRGAWSGSDGGSPDYFAGWSAAGNGGSASSGKEKLEGMLGAALAGLLFVAGVTFAALSIYSKRAHGANREMEPVTTEQESFISSDVDENVDRDFLPEISGEATKSRLDVLQNGDVDTEATFIHAKSTQVDGDATERTFDQDNTEVVEEINDSPLPDGFNTSNADFPTNAAGAGVPPSKEIIKDFDAATLSETENSVTGNDVNMLRTMTHDDLVQSDIVCIDDHYEGSIKAAENSNFEVPFDQFVGSESQFDAASEENLVSQVGSQDLVVISRSFTEDQAFGENKMHSPESFTLDLPSSNPIENASPETSFNLDFRDTYSLLLQNDSVNSSEDLIDSQSRAIHSVTVLEKLGQIESDLKSVNQNGTLSPDSPLNKQSSHSGIPAPCHISATHQIPIGKVLVPPLVDQVQGQALAALQFLKVIEADVQPEAVCTRREYARWLVIASSNLSRTTLSKIYPAMYIENITELAFDDVTQEDPDFPYIQGLAEAGLISSKLSLMDLGHSSNQQDSVLFLPEGPVSRLDLISWKMAVERRQLPQVDQNDLYQCSGYIDIHKINPDAWPALVADLSSGEQGISALAFGRTRLFQPDKPVTKAQAAIALATGDAAEVVNEELARIQAESLAETAVNAHAALVAQLENDLNANFEKELTKEKEKAKALEILAEEVKVELDRLKTEREDEHNSQIKEHAAVESEMEVLSRLRHELEEQLQSLMSNKLEISFERDKINKLRQEAESQNHVIAQLQYELEVERKAMHLARSWAEEEAKRVKEYAKVLEEARIRWKGHLIDVVNGGLQNKAFTVTALEQSPVEPTIERGESLVKNLKSMAAELRFRSSATIEKVAEKILSLITTLKQQALAASTQVLDLWKNLAAKAKYSVDGVQENASEFSCFVGDRTRRMVEDCKEGVGKIRQKFKT
ncbi:uncharacterized protein LOC122018900 isoform X1 [Zingiber officinale]|uniref:uncharacterized protein LOC122018900 isoform X1 n=2 Tax=Zingiber officinale TaxID=94328 RepID=UPI001C4ABEFC|nr:uncharacterized protein LOC122018900 isoform X1 [Zingiber officinale]